ncbi:protein kinase, partial [bacterium]|nr:protein kinase [bacterium]
MKLGTYEVAAEIGRGSAGAVFAARAVSGEKVAIKVLRNHEQAALARFERERRLLSALGEAEGFVPLLDTGTCAEGPFIVMPLLEGGDLRKRLERGPFPVEEAISLGLSLARALGRAHARRLVHRDLKPENILFTRDGR